MDPLDSAVFLDAKWPGALVLPVLIGHDQRKSNAFAHLEEVEVYSITE